jgi:hypothetical protein
VLGLEAADSSLMMPACTGLPPGELISSTTALAPSSSKAAAQRRHDDDSALASVPAAISPLISTTAVCGVDFCRPTACAAGDRPDGDQEAPARQGGQSAPAARRRCSASAANASFSSVARSQPGALGRRGICYW